MPQVFVYRSQAAEYAKKQNWSSFRTKQDQHGMWFAHYEPGTSPAQDLTKYNWVAWVETAWDSTGTRPVKVGVAVISCRLDELTEAERFDLDPRSIIVEPQTPSLWSTKDDTAAPTKERASTGGPRAKSDVESPTKLVWQIADAMAGASRKDVIAACVAKGVHPSTASTQYSRWNRART